MATQTYEEVLRFLVQAEGTPELTKLARAVLSVGEAGEESEQRLAGLLDELSSAASLEKTSSDFKRLGSELIDLNGRYNTTRESVKKIAEAMDSVEQPTRKQQQEFSRARRELESLGQALSETKAEWSQQKTVLDAAGVSTRNYAQANAEIVVKQREAAGAIRLFASEALEARNATASLAQYNERTAAALQKHRDRLAGTGAEARKFGASARSAASDTDRLGQSAERSSGRFSGLRSALAGIATYVGFREAARGVGALGKLASAAENAERSFGRLYGSQERGAEVVAQLRDLAKSNGLAFQQVADDAKKLKAFGLDPLNGSYQALIDQNAAMGGSQETLSGIVLALGQAWAKQKLQGEEILQLIERGVPVWSLLEQATGKNVQELQKLSEQGKLGRETITQLYEAIGKNNAGAAAEGLNSLSGLVSQVSAKWQEFWKKVADSGVTTYFKAQMQELLGSFGGMDALAHRVGTTIIGTIEGIKKVAQQLAPIARVFVDLTSEIGRHAAAVAHLAKVYLALKLVGVAQSFLTIERSAMAATAAMNAASVSTAATAGAFGRLRSRIGSIPNQVKIAVATIGLELAIDQIIQWTEATKERDEVEKSGLKAERDLLASRKALGEQGRKLMAENAAGAKVTMLNSAQISKLTKEEAIAYRAAQEESKRYYRGVQMEALEAGNAVDSAAAREKILAANAELAKLQERFKAISVDNSFKDFGANVVSQFDKLVTSGKSAADSIKGAFDGVNLNSVLGVKQVDEVFTQMSTRWPAAAQALGEEFQSALSKLDAAGLVEFTYNVETAFGKGSEQAKRFANEVAKVNAQKLGVDLQAVMTGFTATGKEAIDAFSALRESLEDVGATADQKSQAMAQAFDAAFKKITTKGELEALKKQMEDAFRSGEISVEAFRQRVEAANGALRQMGQSSGGVALSVADAANRAAQALQNVNRQQQQNTDVVKDNAEKQSGAVAALIKGVKDASDHEREAAERAQASASSMGETLQQTGQVAGTMKEQLKAASDAYSNLGLTTRHVSPQIAEHLRQVKLAFIGSTSGGVDNVLVNAVNAITRMAEAQGKRADQELEKAEATLAKMKPVNEELERLKKRYDMLAEDELVKLADAQRKVREARAAKRVAAQPTVGANDVITSAAPVERILVEVKASPTELASMSGVAKTKLLDEMADGILQRINRSRGNSNRPRAGR